ncbi:MAG: S8 family peptidase [Chloroflexi bacterium]|nr:S8 family peptidase [Chloroflexota bacterium]
MAAVVTALPLTAFPASAAPAPASPQLDDAVIQRLQAAPDSSLIPVIVEGALSSSNSDNLARAQQAESHVRSNGGHVVGSSSLLGASVAELTPAQIRNLANDPAIGHIHIDADVKATAANTDGAQTGSTPIVFQQTTGATQAWQSGDTGKGVTVAVLDSGIANTADAFGTRIKARVDFVDPAMPAQGDPAGHGTHVAGIVAASRSFPSPGMAPDASLVSVRVLDPSGSSRVSTVIRGLEWIIAHKDALGIRVVTMALGAPASGSYREDPLAAAAEMAWRSGLVVVTAAGNDGPAAGTISTPGFDPLVLTVGASDESGTPRTTDDVVPSWSSEGPTSDGVAKPDLVAPGRMIVSVRVPGGTVEQALPTHIEGPELFRLSGTSEATAVTAGAAALVIGHYPQANADQVKALLVRTTTRLAGASPSAQGSGEVNVAQALRTALPGDAGQNVRPSGAFLRLLAQLDFEDVVNALHVNWDHVNWDHVNWDHVNWDHVNWDHVNWDHVNWDHVNWDHVNWDHVNWDHVNWDHVNWDATNLD